MDSAAHPERSTDVTLERARSGCAKGLGVAVRANAADVPRSSAIELVTSSGAKCPLHLHAPPLCPLHHSCQTRHPARSQQTSARSGTSYSHVGCNANLIS